MIPNPWIIVGVLVAWIASSIGAYSYGVHVEKAVSQAGIARLSAVSATLLNTLNQASAAKDAANAQFARDLDAQHAKDLSSIDAARADFEQRLRVIAANRKGSCPDLSRPAADPSKPEGHAAGSDDGRAGFDPSGFAALATSVAKLQADYRACFALVHEWGK